MSIDDYPPVMTSADVAELLGHPVKPIQVMAARDASPPGDDPAPTNGGS